MADRKMRGNKSAISARISRAEQTAAKPKEGNSGDHPGIKLSMIGLSLCGYSRLPSIHLRDEGEPVPSDASSWRRARSRSGHRQRARLAHLTQARLMCSVQRSAVQCSICRVSARVCTQISMYGPAGAGAKEDWKVKRCQSHAAPPSRGGSSGWLCLTCCIAHTQKTTNRQQQNTTWPSPTIGLVH